MASNDFFLNFGSNAKTWASGLSGELKPATESISALASALERYDTAVNEHKGTGSPIDNLFSNLDRVSDQFSELTSALTSTFTKAIEGMNLLREDMTNLLKSVKGVGESATTTARRGRGRPSLKTVDDSDVASAAQLRNAQTLRANVGSANRQMERLSELNGTLATRMEAAADKTKILRQAVGDLQGSSVKATTELDKLDERLRTLGEGVSLPAGGGGGGTFDLGGVLHELTNAVRGMVLNVEHANIQGARIADQAETSSKAVVDNAVETKRFITTARSDQAGPQQRETRELPYGNKGKTREYEVLDRRLDEQARSGRYALGQREVAFSRADIVPGETFRQHIDRVVEQKARFDRVEPTLPTAENFKHGKLLQTISENFFKSGGSTADAVSRALKHNSSAVTQEVVRASGRFVPGNLGELALKQAKAAGLGLGKNGEFSEQSLVEQALAFTHNYRDPQNSTIVEQGTLPRARREALEKFVGSELRLNPHATFGSLGSPEINAVVKDLMARVVNSRGREEEVQHGLRPGVAGPLPAPRNFASVPTFHEEQIPEVLRGIDPQVLYEAAKNFESGLAERREGAATAGAKKQAISEMERRARQFGEYGTERDTTYSRERLSQGYTASTQLGRLKDNLDAARAAKAAAQSQYGNDDDIPKKLLGKYNAAIKTAEARLTNEGPALQALIDASKRATAESVESSKILAARHDEITANSRKVRDLVRNIGKRENLPVDNDNRIPTSSLSDDDIRSQLNLKGRASKVPVDAARAAQIEASRAASEQLLASLQEDPEAFRARAVDESASKAEQARARAEQATKQAAIQARIDAATRELAPQAAAEKRLRDKALDARQKWEERQIAKGVPLSELNEGRRRRTEERAANGGFSSEDLAAEKKYIQARQAREELEARQQQELTDLQQKAREARAKVRQRQLKQGVNPATIAAETAARNAERLANGGFSEGDLPAERRAIQARLATPQGRLEQAIREQRAGVPLAVRSTSDINPEFRFRTGKEFTGPARSASDIERALRAEIAGYDSQLASLGTLVKPAKVTEEHRAQAAEQIAAARAAKIAPLLEEYGLSPKRAAALAGKSTEEIGTALLRAAEKLDAAAREQVLAAEKEASAAEKALLREERIKGGFQEEGKKSGKRSQGNQGGDGKALSTSTHEFLQTRYGERAPKGEGWRQVSRSDEGRLYARPLSGEGTSRRNRGANIAGVATDLEGQIATLQATHAETLARKKAVNENYNNLLAASGGDRSALKGTQAGEQLKALTAESRPLAASLKSLNVEINGLKGQLSALTRASEKAAAAEEEVAAAPQRGGGGGGGGRRRPPTRTGGGGGDDDDGKPRRRSANERANDGYFQEKYLQEFSKFSPESQQAVRDAAAKAQITAETTRLTTAQRDALLPAMAQFRADPAYNKAGADTARRAFAAASGLPLYGAVANQRFLTQGFGLVHPGGGGGGAAAAGQVVETAEAARLEKILAVESVKVREALLGQWSAQQKLNRAIAEGNTLQRASAERAVSVASRRYESAVAEEANQGGIGSRISGLLQHGGRQAVRFAAFQVAFTGLEEVRKLVDSGIQAQSAFVRLQSNLDATHQSAVGLTQALGDISSQTAQPLEHTIQAAAELTGVLKTRGDLLEGTKVASELANITHGTLTAHEAAVGLRDVTDAYGLSGVKAIRGVGDEITRISQVTGVSVKDVIEGTTQLAQEAQSFGLSQRQAAVLAAEVTKNTGETGSAAAEQVSRILSTLNNNKVQQLLEKTINPSTGKAIATQEDFAGKVVDGKLISGAGDALTKLLAQYDQLTPMQRSAIDALVGSGRQARALTGLLRDAAESADLLEKVSDDTGALAEQNSRTLHTLGGEFQQLGANFRRLGKDALDAGLFDILGLIVKALDLLLMTADKVIRGMNSLFDSTPLTKNLLHIGVILAELSLAWKIFGKEAAGALNFLGLKGAATAVADGRAVGLGPVGIARNTARNVESGFAPSPAQLFMNPRYNPNGEIYASREEAATLSAAQRREAALSARTAPIILPVNRGQQLLGRGIVEGEEEAQTLAKARQAVAIEGSVAKVKNFGSAILGVGASALSVIAPLAGLMLVFQGWQEAAARSAKLKADTNDVLDFLSPKPSKQQQSDAEKIKSKADSLAEEATQQRRRWMGYSPGFDQKSAVGQAGSLAWGLTPPGALENAFGVITHPGDFMATAGDLLKGDFSGGNISDKFNRKVDTWTAVSETKQNDSWNNESDLVQTQANIDADFEKNARGWVKQAGDKYAQAAAAAYLIQLKQQMDDAAAHRLENLRGIKDIDILTLQQMESAATFISGITSLDSRVLKVDPSAMKQAFEDTGINPDSKTGKLLSQSLTDDTVGRTKDTIGVDKELLPQLEAQIAIKPISDPDRDRLIKARDAVLANLQQQMNLLDQLATGNPTALADLLGKVGDLDGANVQLQKANDAFRGILKGLESSDPRYYQDLNSIIDNETKIAQNKVQPGIDAANLDAAGTANPVRQARDRKTAADLQLQAARDAQAKQRADYAAKQKADQARVDALAAQLAAASAVNNANLSLPGGIRSDPEFRTTVDSAATVRALQSQLASAQATLATDKQLAATTGLANSAAVVAAQEASKQAALAVTQSLHDQADSAIDLKAAIASNTGNGEAAARANLAKAQGDVKFAVAQYGANSQQANQARIAVIAANAQIQQAIDDKLNASLDLEISMLSNRGNDSDKRRILDDRVQQAQNNLNAFKARGGKTDSAEGKRLTAGVNDARQARINQGAEIEISTLDFMRETYQISSSQEIKALQEILKNKKLSQDEVRNIMLKIQGLRDAAQGQFNLGDIKIPTPYEARRYMKASSQGLGYQSTYITNTSSNQFSFTGLSKEEVLSIITRALGPTATQRAATTARK